MIYECQTKEKNEMVLKGVHFKFRLIFNYFFVNFTKIKTNIFLKIINNKFCHNFVNACKSFKAITIKSEWKIIIKWFSGAYRLIVINFALKGFSFCLKNNTRRNE